MYRPGPRNLITDISGLTVGHATDDRAGTGVTTLLCDGAWVASVDIGGGGPGVRETETLAPENVVAGIHGVVLSGGSVFGLAAADGVVTRLSARGIGMRLLPEGKPIPIIPGAVLHDLSNPGDKDWGKSHLIGGSGSHPSMRPTLISHLDRSAPAPAPGSAGARGDWIGVAGFRRRTAGRSAGRCERRGIRLHA